MSAPPLQQGAERVLLQIVDREGREHQLQASTGHPLMPVLAAESLGIDGVCGGCCVCATCHVYVEDPHKLLAQPSMDEELLLAELLERRPNSRLACQIVVSAGLSGLSIRIAPEEL